MHGSAGVVCGIVGLLVGMPLRGVIARTPQHEPLRTRPHCGNCGSLVQGTQVVPLLAMLRRRTRCTTCATSIWPRHPVVEITTAILLGLAGFRFGWAPALPAYLVFFASLVAITVVDLRHYLIPLRIVFTALFTCLAVLVVAAIVGDDFTRLEFALGGMALSWLFYFIVWAAYPKGMGYGDVRLSALIGLLAGWLGFGNVVQAVLLGLLLGAGTGVLFVLMQYRTRRDAIPFGPFMSAGAALAVLYGKEISDLWMP